MCAVLLVQLYAGKTSLLRVAVPRVEVVCTHMRAEAGGGCQGHAVQEGGGDYV